MPVFPLEYPPDEAGYFQILPGDLKHLTQVLRHRPGDSFEIILPEGRHALALLMKEGGKIFGKVDRFLEKTTPPPLPLWLGIGMIRWPRLEWLIEKATELGVKRLTPLLLKRSRHTKIENFSELKYNRLIKISKESLKQCGRVSPLQIDRAVSFMDYLKLIPRDSPNYQKVLFNEHTLAPLLRDLPLHSDRESIFLVGPEGGFSETEIQAAEEAGFTSVSLGPSTLRAETAALYGACALRWTRQT